MEAYLPIVVMTILATLFAFLSFTASLLLGPRRPTAAKTAPYESGIVPKYEPAERFPVRFYLVAMIFIVFDIEIVFLYPFAVALDELRVFGLVEMGIFVLALIVAFGYLLSSGALEWGPGRQADRTPAPVLRARGLHRPAPGDGGDAEAGPSAEPAPEPGRAA
jgi:NADH-quinone oxidoreductase subunit A